MSGLLQAMSNDLIIPERDLIYLIRSAPYRYKVYQIPKRSGKLRTIAQPAKEVKPLQYWVMENVLSDFPIHPSATAYRKGRNILDNASPHAFHRYVCKLDFRNFFPSIKSGDLEKFLRRNPLGSVWNEQEIEYLSRILFWRKKRGNNLQLSIGAPSSPLLSNVLLYQFDVKTAELCARLGVNYTRYADDLTFSTSQQRILRRIEPQITKICRELKSPKLVINAEKTVHASKKGLRKVTGLVLTNQGRVSIGREQKRQLRATFHRYIQNLLDPTEIMSFAGMLCYVKSVEPDFLNRLAQKYGADIVKHLLSTRGPIGA